MKQVNIYEAKTKLSQLVDQAARGETVVIAKSGTPVAKLVPLGEPEQKRKIRIGGMEGKIKIHGDFDEPLPDWLLDAFEGKNDDDPEGLERAARAAEEAGKKS